MGRKRNEAPELKLHRASGLYYLLLDSVRHYLGKDRAKAEEQRRRLLAERLLRGPGASAIRAGRITVEEVCDACDEYARAYYSAGQMPRVGQAIEAVSQLYGATPADEFDQVRLAAVRAHLLARPHQRKPHLTLSRNYVNSLIGVIQTLWAWASTRGLVPGDKAQSLQLVRAVRKNKGGRETARVLGVPPETVSQTLPACNHVVRAMVLCQQLTGMRPGEVCVLLRGEISTSTDQRIQVPDGPTVHAVEVEDVLVWVAAPGAHKTSWKGKVRIIAIGPRAQEVLRPFLDRPEDTPLFSPAEAMATRLEALRAGRRSKVQPSQTDRGKDNPAKRPGTHYTTASYGRSIKTAIAATQRNGMPVVHWHPNQLRHAAGTMAFDAFDQHHAQAVLGHSSPNTTATYIDTTLKKAAAVAAKIG